MVPTKSSKVLHRSIHFKKTAGHPENPIHIVNAKPASRAIFGIGTAKTVRVCWFRSNSIAKMDLRLPVGTMLA